MTLLTRFNGQLARCPVLLLVDRGGLRLGRWLGAGPHRNRLQAIGELGHGPFSQRLNMENIFV